MDQIKQGGVLDCVIESIGFGGEGIVKIDGFVVFIQGGIPGQKVKAVITKKKPGFAEARILEVLEKSADEITPKCSHVGKCGGCKWQQIPYEKQLSYKEKHVQECLEHIGGFQNIAMESIVPSPLGFGYRNKVEFSFGYENMRVETDETGKRTYFDENPTLGFHKPGRWQEVVEIQYCHLASENVNHVFEKVKEWALHTGRTVYNPKIHRGFFRQLLIRENVKGELMLNMVVNTEVRDEFFLNLITILKELNTVKSFYRTIHTGMNDDWSKGDIKCLFGESEIYEEVLGMNFSISPQSFFQTNTRGAEKLYSKVQEYAHGTSPKTILDLYCGTGTIGQILAGSEKNTQIVGLELLESAVADAYKNAELNDLKNVEFVAGAAEKTLPDVLSRYDAFDLVVIDPPRMGMHPKALQTLLSLMPKNIVYVSCNPATLARDLKILTEQGYVLEKLCPVDMFPHTPHIEVVTKLKLG